MKHKASPRLKTRSWKWAGYCALTLCGTSSAVWGLRVPVYIMYIDIITAQCLLSFSFWKFITQHHLQFVLYPFSMFAVNFNNRCREHIHIRRKGGGGHLSSTWVKLAGQRFDRVTSSYIYKKSVWNFFKKWFFLFFYWENYKKCTVQS